MDDEQHVDAGGNFRRVHRHFLEVEQLAEMSDELPGPRQRRVEPRHHGAGEALDRQGGHQADGLALGVGEVVDQLGQVIFEEGFAVR